MFSEYIKLTGRGEKGRRPLTMAESQQALTDYLNGDATLLQMAVLLMLQRVRCETPEEAAGYISALRTKIDSDWQTYYGSSPELSRDVELLGTENFSREILYYCKSKAECSYVEAREQFSRRVLESDDYYNGHIQVRVHGSHIKGKLSS